MSTAEANEEEVRTVAGIVTDATRGTPVAGAIVSSLEYSAATDVGGRFFLALPRDLEEVVVVANGYQSEHLQLTAGDEVGISVELTRLDETSGEVIEVYGEAPPPEERAEPKSYDLGPEVIRRVPGSGNDALKTLQTLPGVARVPYGMGGLVLRGTSPRDSNVYLDGIEVPLLYHFGGLSSFYPSSTLESMELIPGGYSTEFGRGQGGVVLIGSRPGRADRWRVSSELSMVDLSAQADGPAGRDSSWSFGVRRSVVDAVLPFFDTDAEITAAPRYYDGQLRYDTKPWHDARFTANLFGSDDEIGLIYGERLDRIFKYGTQFARLGFELEQRWGASTLTLSPWVGFDEFSLESARQRMTSGNKPRGARARFQRNLTVGWIAVGLDTSGGDYDVLSITEADDGNDVIRREDDYTNTALWAEAMVRIADGRVNFRPGARLEHYSLSDEAVVDPRLVVTHELGNITLRESVGLFHQPPSVADALWGNDDLESSHSIQFTLGGELALGQSVTLAVTGFYSMLRNLPVDDPDAPMEALANLYESKIGALQSSREFIAKQFGTFSALENTGTGKNYGVEMLARYVGEHGFGWISYTGSRALRFDGQSPDDEWNVYVLDQPHVLTIVGSLELGRSWQLGARGRYASGNPITPIVGGMQVSPTRWQPIYGEPLSQRLPDYFQLDIRLDRVWIRDWGTISTFLDLQNVTRRKNVEGHVYEDDYSSFEETHGLPLFPAFGISYTPAD